MSFKQRSSGIYVPSSLNRGSNNFDELEVFARNGFVHMRRPDDQGHDYEQKAISVESARKRRKALIESLEYMRREYGETAVANDRGPMLERFIDRLTNVIKQAEAQGPHTHADMRRARVRSMPATVSMPATLNMSGKTLP